MDRRSRRADAGGQRCYSRSWRIALLERFWQARHPPRYAAYLIPSSPSFPHSSWRLRRVGIDYHVEVDRALLQRAPSLRPRRGRGAADRRGVEIFLKGERIAAHLRMSGNHKHTTMPEHMPSSHRRYAGWTIERIRADARLIGPATAALCELILESAAASRTGLSRLSRHRPAGRLLWRRAPRGGGGARHRDRRQYLRLGQIHPRQQSRSAAAAKARRGRDADPASQHPRSALLQLGETNLLKHPTLDQLHALGLHGMAKAFAETRPSGEAEGLGHHEWLGLLLDREASLRQDKRLAARLRVAKLRQQACVEDVDYRTARGLDRALFQKLAEGEWIDAHDNLALVGPTGVGKSWLASRLGHKACRDNRSVALSALAPALRGPGAGARRRTPSAPPAQSLGRADLLILDDWGLEPLDAAARHDLLEILEERYGRRSTMITSQLPVDRMARDNRRSDLRRRHPGPPRSQRPPHRTRRRKHAADPRKTEPERLDPSRSSTGDTNPIGQRASRPGRHHSVTVGGIIQESRAALSRYTRATSSESAGHFPENTGGSGKADLSRDPVPPEQANRHLLDERRSKAKVSCIGLVRQPSLTDPEGRRQRMFEHSPHSFRS